MSTETLTPRTDKAFAQYITDASPIPFRDFARSLERENAELRGKLGALAYELSHSLATQWIAKELRAILNEGSK